MNHDSYNHIVCVCARACMPVNAFVYTNLQSFLQSFSTLAFVVVICLFLFSEIKPHYVAPGWPQTLRGLLLLSAPSNAQIKGVYHRAQLSTLLFETESLILIWDLLIWLD